VPVVATVHARSHPLTDALRQRPGIEQFDCHPGRSRGAASPRQPSSAGGTGGCAVPSEG
jgi:hypothetical protein